MTKRPKFLTPRSRLHSSRANAMSRVVFSLLMIASVLIVVTTVLAGPGGHSVKPAGAASWTPTSTSPASTETSISCTSSTFCVVVGSRGQATIYNGTTAASSDIDGLSTINGVSCVDTSTCIAVDDNGNALVFNGTSWSLANIDGAVSINAVSCATASFCIAVDVAGNAFTYNGGSAWSGANNIDGTTSINAVSCSSTTFCAAGDATGNVLNFDHGTWTSTPSLSTVALNGISCPSATFCIVVDADGSDSTFDGTAWSPILGSGNPDDIDASNALLAVACASDLFCVATDNDGNAVEYQGGGTWAPPEQIDGAISLASVACVSTTRCIAVAKTGTARQFDGTDWSILPQIRTSNQGSVSCPTASFCVATDAHGHASSYNGSSWSTNNIDGTTAINGVSCTSSSFCIAVDAVGNALTFLGSSWSTSNIDGTTSLRAISCTSQTFCVAVDAVGNALTFLGSSWSTSNIDGTTSINAISCTSSSFCAAVDDVGNALLFGGTWSTTNVTRSTPLTGVSCGVVTGGSPTTTCYASDATGHVWFYRLRNGVYGTLGITVGVPSTAYSGDTIDAAAITATIAGGGLGPDASGQVSFFVFQQQDPPTNCDVSKATLVDSGISAAQSVTTSTQTFTPPSDGNYWWYAIYSGTQNSNSAYSLCGPQMPETVVNSTNTTLSAGAPSAAILGNNVLAHTITATLTDATAPTGSISFTVFHQTQAPTICTSGGVSAGTATISDNGTYSLSSDSTVGTGNYWWYVSYGGDGSNPPEASACGNDMPETTVSPWLAINADSAGNALNGIACSGLTASIGQGKCFTVDIGGNAAAFDGSTWKTHNLRQTTSLNAISCSSSKFCVTVDDVGNIVTYTGPSITHTVVDPPFSASTLSSSLSCISASFCAVAEGISSSSTASGNIDLYNGSTWTTTTVDAGIVFGGISCVTTTFCVAAETTGGVETYNGATWSRSIVDAAHVLDSISCSSTTFCAAAERGTGNVDTYNGTTHSWSVAHIDGVQDLVVSCTAATFCMAVDSAGNAMTFDGSVWSSPSNIDGSNSLVSVSCSSATFCVAVDTFGNLATYDGTTWTIHEVAVNNLFVYAGSGSVTPYPQLDGAARIAFSAVSCISATSCMAVDNAGNRYVFDGSSWQAISFAKEIGAQGAQIDQVSCYAADACFLLVGLNLYGVRNYSLATPVISFLGPSTISIGGAVSATAFNTSISSEVPLTGTLTFGYVAQAVQPSSCVGGTVVGSATVTGAGTYAPAVGFTPPAAGTYWKYYVYSGDQNNAASDPSFCIPSMVTVNRVTPTLTLSSLPSSAVAGSTVAGSSLSSTIGAGFTPTGTVTFRVFQQTTAPSVCTSGGTIVGTVTESSGAGTYSLSSTLPSGYVLPLPGNYWWYASYGGDTNNNTKGTTCGAAMSKTVASTGQPSISPSIPSALPIGSTVATTAITAIVSAGASPTGSVTFTAFNQASPPVDCTTGGTSYGTVTLPGAVTTTGSGTVTASLPFTPSALGTYWWYVSYGGDPNNASAASTCNSTSMAKTTVTKATPVLSVGVPSTLSVGGTINAASISGTISSGDVPQGHLTYTVFNSVSHPTDCSTGGTIIETDSVSGNNTYHPTASFTPPGPGHYWWYLSYDGDSNNVISNSACDGTMPETSVGSSPSLSISTTSPITVGATLNASAISAQLASGLSPTGQITFSYFKQPTFPTTCSSGGTVFGSATVNGNNTYSELTDFQPTSAGTYWWYASYGGDSQNAPQGSPCGSASMGKIIVNAAVPTFILGAQSAYVLGSTAGTPAISASLTSGYQPGGTITFTVFAQSSQPTTCTGGVNAGTTTVNGNGSYSMPLGYSPAGPGTYWWYATYSGDSNNAAATSVCTPSAMPMSIASVATPTLTASVPTSISIGSVLVASSINAVLSSAYSPSGNFTVTVFHQDAAPATCASGGTSLGIVSLPAAGSPTNSASVNAAIGFTPPSPGNYWWYATYGGDTNNVAAASPCGASMAETIVAQALPILTGSSMTPVTLGTTIPAAAMSVTLAAGYAPTGSLSFGVAKEDSPTAPCSTTGTPLGTVQVKGNGTYSAQNAFTPTTTGTYYLFEHYGGDLNNSAVDAPCTQLDREIQVSGPATSTASSTTQAKAVPSITASGTGRWPSVIFVNGSTLSVMLQCAKSSCVGNTTIWTTVTNTADNVRRTTKLKMGVAQFSLRSQSHKTIRLTVEKAAQSVLRNLSNHALAATISTAIKNGSTVTRHVTLSLRPEIHFASGAENVVRNTASATVTCTNWTCVGSLSVYQRHNGIFTLLARVPYVIAKRKALTKTLTLHRTIAGNYPYVIRATALGGNTIANLVTHPTTQ